MSTSIVLGHLSRGVRQTVGPFTDVNEAWAFADRIGLDPHTYVLVNNVDPDEAIGVQAGMVIWNRA